MNAEPFDPRYPTPISASLNRVRIVDLPGAPPEILGKIGYELLSSSYLREQMQAHLAELDLTPQKLPADERDWPVLLSKCLLSDNVQTRQAAQAITRQFGRNLGYLLRMLKRGNPAARPEWDVAAWEYWRAVKLVTLGGGLTQGMLGQHLIEDAARVFLEADETPPNLRRSPYGSNLPLIGAARYVPAGCDAALVMDFGGSFVKRARAVYQNDVLIELQCLESVATRYFSAEEAQQLFNFMVETIAATWCCLNRTDSRLVSTIPVSLASYVDRDGQPSIVSGSPFSALRTLVDNIQAGLSKAISEQLGQPVQVIFIHDGTAAASSHDEGEATTIMLGTAIGIGYRSSIDTLRPIHEPINVTSFGKR